jgi:hypothetical protein
MNLSLLIVHFDPFHDLLAPVYEHPLLKNQNSANLELDVEVMFFIWSPKSRRSASDTFAEICKVKDDFYGMRAIEKFFGPSLLKY